MKQLLILLVALALLPTVSATLTVDSFSCNSQATTASVETGEAMNCQAIILNSDLQVAASVSQVSLVVSGSWADESSYTVAVNSNIGAGQSKTVTIQNIVPSTPGSDHKFLHLDIDGSAHTEEVDSLSVNAVKLKSLTATPAVSTAASGASYEISSTVTSGGSYSDVTLSLTTSNCRLATDETGTKSIGAMGNNAQATRSWTVIQGSSTCTATITATGTSGPVSSTKTKSTTITLTGGGGNDNNNPPGSSGGGGSGSSTNTTNATATNATANLTAETVQQPAAGGAATAPESGQQQPAAASEEAGTEEQPAVPPTLLMVLVAAVVIVGGVVWVAKRGI